jgi:hypothetical protein
MEYKEKYTPEQLANKLKEVEEFEAKWGKSLRTKAIRKFCESKEYRKREWQFRQATVNLFKHNNKIL